MVAPKPLNDCLCFIVESFVAQYHYLLFKNHGLDSPLPTIRYQTKEKK